MNRKPTGGEISFLEMYESLDHVQESLVTDFIKKFEMKMHGSSMETAKGWVDGIGEASKAEKEKILKGIIAKGMVKESGSRTFNLEEAGKTVAGLEDDRLKKLYNQMKDEQLSGAAASQFKAIVKELKNRGISLKEASFFPKTSKADKMVFTWAEINIALGQRGMPPARIADVLVELIKGKKAATTAKRSLKHRVKSPTDESADILSTLIENTLITEGSTENARDTLKAILGMFKGHEDNDIYKMGKGIMDYYKKEGSFAPKHANWIWKTSVALFKK